MAVLSWVTHNLIIFKCVDKIEEKVKTADQEQEDVEDAQKIAITNM